MKKHERNERVRKKGNKRTTRKNARAGHSVNLD